MLRRASLRTCARREGVIVAQERHVFSFVVHGVELSPEHQDRIAKAVGQAGTAALAENDVDQEYVVLPYARLWRGLPAVSLSVFEQRPIAETLREFVNSPKLA
jgi:hypothetical protein